MEQSKEQFFALYIGQPLIITQGTAKAPSDCPYSPGEICCHLDGVVGKRIVIGYIAENKYDVFDQAALSLRSVDQLTEAEAMVVANIFDLDDLDIAITNLQEWIEALFNETAGYYIDGYTGNQLLSAIDYLRSIGICLSDYAIKQGWAVIKED